MQTRPLGIRWTIGNVSPRGFEALRLSIWGAWNAFGPDAAYVVCVNTVACKEARARAGSVPEAVAWREASEAPAFLREHLDHGMAEGVAWKFAPLRCFPDGWELSLDNDCILWDVPAAIRHWLTIGDHELCLLEEDVKRCLGQFEDSLRAGGIQHRHPRAAARLRLRHGFTEGSGASPGRASLRARRTGTAGGRAFPA